MKCSALVISVQSPPEDNRKLIDALGAMSAEGLF